MNSLPEIETETIERGDCKITLQKRNLITISTQIDQWSKEWGMKLPDILFGDNQLVIQKKESDKQLMFSPQIVLKHRCREDEFEPLTIQLEHITIDPSFKVFTDGYHWAFPSLMGASGCEQEEPSNNELPWDLLKKRDPILWNNSFILFEDHLHDFGFIVCECKIRVMESYFYILQQIYLRIDYQCVYLISHRYFHAFSDSSILHDYSLERLDWKYVDESNKRLLFSDIHNISYFTDSMELKDHRISSIPF